MSKVVIFNKPFQVLSQFTSQDGKSSLKDFLDAPELEACYPAGRLDYDSEGLLLLTNDGALQNRISNPDFKLPKHYWAQVEGKPEDIELQILREGVTLKDGKCKPAKVRIIEEPDLWIRTPPIRTRKNDITAWLEIIISEGRNRQVRRMCAEAGYPCLRLVRFQIGNWKLDDLEPGEYRIENIHLPKQKHFQRKNNKNHS